MITASSAQRLDPIAELSRKQRTGAPPAYKFTLEHPSEAVVGAEAFETLKLTARFAAVRGGDFVGALADRERHNPEFSFLQPGDALFRYFSALVDKYRRVLEWKEAARELREAFALHDVRDWPAAEGARCVVRMTIDRASQSCGYSIPKVRVEEARRALRPALTQIKMPLALFVCSFASRNNGRRCKRSCE